MKLTTGFLILMLLIGVCSAVAQESQCLEIWFIWSDEVRHEVNLDTGTVVAYEPVIPTAPSAEPNRNSFNGQYSVIVESNGTPSQGYRLTLTDNRVGVSVVLATNIYEVQWSPNSTWLAYIQTDEGTAPTLQLINADGEESRTITLPEEGLAEWSTIGWSPNGASLAVMTNIEIAPERYDVRLYSAPDFTLLTNYVMSAFSPSLLWSPSGNYFVTYGDAYDGMLVNAQTGQTYDMGLGGSIRFHMRWSPDETYLVISYSASDWLDGFMIMTMQGELVLEDIIVPVSYEGVSLDWVNAHQIIAEVSTSTGFYDLTFFDLQTSEQVILLPFAAIYDLSPDSRYVAAREQDTPRLLRFFDMTQFEEHSINVTVTEDISNFIWNSVGLELIVLFGDRSLRGYDFEADTWRDIASIPDDRTGMRLVPCAH
jgi:hypothetical protein